MEVNDRKREEKKEKDRKREENNRMTGKER